MNTRDSINSVKNIIRAPYAWLGGYSKQLVMNDGECLCAECVKDNYRLILRATRNKDKSGWQAHAAEIHWEGPAMQCANCNKELPSEYGDPEEV